ncbi:MAG: response regulator [Paludibacter sp.]|jgi:signal transduction histidine kinase/ligand-binding sensor domain-containing protein/DNA-binding NarL/FixJ family response regulator|nr:response regulator [Paludibacter sp.]
MPFHKLKLFAFAFFFAFTSLAQEQAVFRHYSVADGLSQNTVVAMAQDRKGFLWFGTWDGLNKFDGRVFTVYKSAAGDESDIATNRIDFIHEDFLGFIWFQTYDGAIHRFNPKTEQFYSVRKPTTRFTNPVEREKRFIETSGGELWVATNDIGAIRIITNPETEEVTVTEYSTFSENKIENNRVNFVFEDDEKKLWLGTNAGLNRINTVNGQIQTFQPFADKEENAFLSIDCLDSGVWLGDENGNAWHFSPQRNQFERIHLADNVQVTSIEKIDKNHLVFTTNGAGFFIYNTQTKKLNNFSSATQPLIRNNNFATAKADSYGVVWFETDNEGLFRYRLSDNSLRHFHIKLDGVNPSSLMPNFMLIEDVKKRLWINRQGGGFVRYNRENDELEYFFNEPSSLGQRFTNIIHSAFADRDGNLWLCTYNKGLEKISFITPYFKLGKPNTVLNSITSNEIRAIFQTSDGRIFVGTKDGAIRILDENFDVLGILSEDGKLNSALPLNDLAYCFLEDKNKNIWIGTKGGGALKLTQTNADFKNPAYRIERYKHNPQDNNSLSNDNIYSIIEDNRGRIIIGTYGGGLNVAANNGGVISFLNASNTFSSSAMTKCSKIRHLLFQKETNTLWVASSNGLLQIDNFLEKTMTEYYIEKLPNDTKSLSNNDVHYLLQDKQKRIWIGTFGGGLNLLEQRATKNSAAKFCNFTAKNVLTNDIVLSIQEDRSGNLWTSSETAISVFNTSTFAFQNYSMTAESENAHFSEAASLFTRDGKMIFGSNNGYYYFIPEKISHSDAVPNIEFTNFQLFNNDVPIGSTDSPLRESIGYAQQIVLNHTQSVFSIEYVALDFSEQNKIQYAFMLQNFENDWNYVHNQQKATYTNLPQGTYYFKVRSTNSEGVWVDNEKQLKIIIKPSFWETPFAYFLYFLFVSLALFTVYYLTKVYSRLKSNVIIEQQVTDIKLRFFTNISHELRTPLTLILGPIENILTNEKISDSIRSQLVVVQGNAQRMLRMINQILEFRKIQNQKLRLKVQPTRIAELVAKICENFSKEAHDKKIDFTVKNTVGDAVIWLDCDKIDIIIYNLLSNAFKFTASGKRIEVFIESASMAGDVQVRVKDEGVGIPREKRLFIFDRFVSANEIRNIGNQKSTGIGLNLVKELVDAHKGIIEVESEVGKGTTFTVIFRSGKEHFGDEVDYIVEDEHITINEKPSEQDDKNIAKNSKLPLILIVEDNADMRGFLETVLSKKYRTANAEDGGKGFELAQKLIPDIVISDLMMPNIDGLQLTEMLKQNELTSHIPVVLLTAKSAMENSLQALKSGADDYITKPFSPVLLEARIENIIEQRKRLQERYQKQLFTLEPAKIEVVSSDDKFLVKLMEVMEKNIDNNDLSVDDLVSAMALGRTVFFHKLKGLTGLAPIEFIREIRIKRAAQLLQTGEYTASQVTFMVGMSDARYFSKCFKKTYGVTPTEYKKINV